jgi:cell division protease FtsH
MAPVVITNRYLDGGAQLDCSQETAAKIDLAVKRLLDEGFATATRVLTENRALLDEIAEYLLLKETITGEELMKFINAAKDPQPAEETAENTEE